MGNGEQACGSSERATPRVALLVDTSRGDERALIEGVVRYARLHGPWRFSVQPCESEQSIERLLDWGATAFVARIACHRVGDRLLATGCPIVALDVAQSLPRTDDRFESINHVVSDSHGAAAMAIDHVVERGFRRVAFVGEPDRLGSAKRGRAVRDCAEAGGCTMHDFPLPSTPDRRECDRSRLADWLATLPKPIALVACHDARGHVVLEAARDAGVRVPDELAVVGIGDDGLLCEVADPSLTSVAFNTEIAGFRLAERLDTTMRSGDRTPWRVTIEPTRVVARRSTDVSAVADPDVAAAMHFIHEHAAESIGVADIVQPLCVSRRALELRFRNVIGRTLYGELQRVRVERAKRLLIESELPIPRVAEGAGFSSGAYLAQVFRKAVGMTPAEFRKSRRG